MQHTVFLSAAIFLLFSCATPKKASVPKIGPKIEEITQIDFFPIGFIENEDDILAQSDYMVQAPITTIKKRDDVFPELVEITWVQNGSGIDLIKVNQSLNDTWHLLNEALNKTDYAIESVNEQFGKVLVSLPDGIEFIDATEDSFLISKSESQERFEIEFRVDAVNDGTVISLQFTDNLLLPVDDNLIHLDNIRELMTQE
ncbi:MAG: hypothetical protein HRU38_19140 [Saccharospirillaceae bacterium]|nr:hypothetical protein [Pseudomonadales bacterium]NRB80751.1 hypothetical protein [Saccharospirillaceae bacterium]